MATMKLNRDSGECQRDESGGNDHREGSPEILEERSRAGARHERSRDVYSLGENVARCDLIEARGSLTDLFEAIDYRRNPNTAV
jgi:hypothetical protein